MATRSRIALIAVFLLLAAAGLAACGGGDDTGGAAATQSPTTLESAAAGQIQTTGSSDTAPSSDATTVASGGDQAPAEAEVKGMPDEFPADVPVHPGTVTACEATQVTKSTVVHQLTVKTKASLDAVIEWYRTKLPAGWSVGFLEQEDGEAKIALNGGDYAPASEDGRGGGVIIGVFEGDSTEIVTTVTVMGE